MASAFLASAAWKYQATTLSPPGVPGNWWPGDAELHGFVEGFPEALRHFSSTPELGLWHEPGSHFWAVLRDQVPVAIVSIEGRVYRAERHYDLAHEYAANERRMLPLVADILSDLLP